MINCLLCIEINKNVKICRNRDLKNGGVTNKNSLHTFTDFDWQGQTDQKNPDEAGQLQSAG